MFFYVICAIITEMQEGNAHTSIVGQSPVRFTRRFLFMVVILAAIAILAGAYELGRMSVYQAHPELSRTEQANAILAKVGKLIKLPTGEIPQMATINDAEGAKKAQPFLINAENGDVLIVYQNAGEALLYRPSSNMLIAVGPVDTAAPQQQVAPPVPTNATTTASSTYATSTQKKK